MISDDHAWEQETKKIVAACEEDIERLKVREAAIRQERETKEHEKATFEEALRLWRVAHGVPEPAPAVEEVLRSRFAGMSLGQQLVSIARENQGTLNVREASRLLTRAVMYPSAAKAGATIYPLLGKKKGKWKGVFRKVSPGIYRATTTQASAPETHLGQNEERPRPVPGPAGLR
ncbi:MAG: hypothetical protein HY691_01890 [Chloroflexi bacterium]|nr:hypothetical protein [Chloroflexota bacterium]